MESPRVLIGKYVINLIERGRGVHGNVQYWAFDGCDPTVKIQRHRPSPLSIIALPALALMAPHQLDPLSGAPDPAVCASTACAWVSGIFALSAIPALASPLAPASDSLWRKLAHVVEYAGLTLLVFRAVRLHVGHNTLARVVAALVTWGYAVSERIPCHLVRWARCAPMPS